MGKSGANPVRTAERVIEGAEAQGVSFIFGVPGAKIDQVYEVLSDEGPFLVVCRHEQNAAFMESGPDAQALREGPRGFRRPGGQRP
jgi:acetolactate synthase-1/2/3 large subunit